MMALAVRRLSKIGTVFLFVSAAVLVFQAYSVTLLRFEFLSGWTLLWAIIFLAAYNIRKKIPYIPLGSSSLWLQFHLYVGWFTFLLFSLHIEFRLPNGLLETTLSGLYLAVSCSGVAGLWISRNFPPRLTRHGRFHFPSTSRKQAIFEEEIIFERIPGYYLKIREEAEALVVRSAEKSKSHSISDFYIDRLNSFFSGPKNFWLHLMGSDRSLDAILNEVSILQRYLNQEEKLIIGELRDLIRLKHHVDFQYSLQWLMKHWPFLHVPLTYALLLLIVVHVTLVYSFSQGNP